MDGLSCKGDAAFEQESANLVDQRGATLYQSISHAVHGLPVQLLLRFDRYKTHVLLSYGFGDGFGVEQVVLVRLPIRLHKLRRNQSHLVALVAQCGSHKVCSSTSLKADQRGGQVRAVSQQLRTREFLA